MKNYALELARVVDRAVGTNGGKACVNTNLSYYDAIEMLNLSGNVIAQAEGRPDRMTFKCRVCRQWYNPDDYHRPAQAKAERAIEVCCRCVTMQKEAVANLEAVGA